MSKEDKIEEYQKEQLLIISQGLKQLRLTKYPNYEHLAYDIGMSRSQYGTYENGQNITVATLMKILKQFDMTIFDFFDFIKTTITSDENTE